MRNTEEVKSSIMNMKWAEGIKTANSPEVNPEDGQMGWAGRYKMKFCDGCIRQLPQKWVKPLSLSQDCSVKSFFCCFFRCQSAWWSPPVLLVESVKISMVDLNDPSPRLKIWTAVSAGSWTSWVSNTTPASSSPHLQKKNKSHVYEDCKVKL